MIERDVVIKQKVEHLKALAIHRLNEEGGTQEVLDQIINVLNAAQIKICTIERKDKVKQISLWKFGYEIGLHGLLYEQAHELGRDVVNASPSQFSQHMWHYGLHNGWTEGHREFKRVNKKVIV